MTTPNVCEDKADNVCAFEAYREIVYKNDCKRNPQLENIIVASPDCAYFYAKNVVKGRWIEAEDAIINVAQLACYYAKFVLKDKLPEKMHNRMLFYAMENPNNEYVKEYFEFLSHVNEKVHKCHF